MSADNQQERPNYRMHYRAEVYDPGYGDDSFDGRKDFHALNDNDATKKANEFLREMVAEHQRKYNENPSGYVRDFRPHLMNLERIAYVFREVEETTRVKI